MTVAAQAQRLLTAIGDLAAALQPRHQRIRIGRLDVERACETAGRTGCAFVPLKPTCVAPGARKSSRSIVQDLVVGPQIGGKILHRTAAQHDLLGAEFDLRRNRGLRDRRHQRPQRRQQAGPARRRCLSLATNLSASSCRAESAACSSGDAPKRMSPSPENFSARLFRAIADLELLEPCGGRIGLDPCRYPPRRYRRRHPCLLGAAGAARIIAPSKRGARASKLSTPSRSADSARAPGSMLR